MNNVETLNTDISSWEARLSGVHATAKFHVGCDEDSPTASVGDFRIDEISTYASVTGLNFDTTRTYEWWASASGPSLLAGTFWDSGVHQFTQIEPAVLDDSAFGSSVSLAGDTKAPMHTPAADPMREGLPSSYHPNEAVRAGESASWEAVETLVDYAQRRCRKNAPSSSFVR